MEGIALTPSEIEAITAAANRATGGAGGAEGDVYYTYVSNDGEAIEEPTEAVELVNSDENQEVIVYDEETGEYQKCVYVTENPTEAETEQVEQAVVPEEQQSVDLQALLDSGSISLEEFAALAGQNVSIVQQEEIPEEQQILYQTTAEGDLGLEAVTATAAVPETQQYIQDEDGVLKVIVNSSDINDENINKGNVLEDVENSLVQCGKCNRTFR